MPLTSPGNDDDTGENHQPTLRKNTAEPVEQILKQNMQAPEQAIAWARAHGGTEGCVHHSGHGSQYISLVYSTRVEEYGMLPSTGTVGDSYDNALAERTNNTYKRELIWINRPYRTVGELEYATMRFVSWYNSKRLHASLGYRTPEQAENEYYQKQAAQTVSQ